MLDTTTRITFIIKQVGSKQLSLPTPNAVITSTQITLYCVRQFIFPFNIRSKLEFKLLLYTPANKSLSFVQIQFKQFYDKYTIPNLLELQQTTQSYIEQWLKQELQTEYITILY
ncbi:Hypothetical_protein [Hexamita inflata]|uniref:Hypothetical_protein n=1 Tax=Hexamita inflata TaxID=28002 RepID=A0AA86UCN3_9EUKA|nr:Hypothetical protein HINF_LOCUS24528 [Hexamita inflata]